MSLIAVIKGYNIRQHHMEKHQIFQENDAKVQSFVAAFSWFLKVEALLTQENVSNNVDSSHGVAVFMLNDVLTYS